MHSASFLNSALVATIAASVAVTYARAQQPQTQDTAARAALAAFVDPQDYGVPSSPAFELLPDKPRDVTHIVTPHDFQSNVSTWHDGDKLRAGVAFDARPFVMFAGSLTNYNKDWLRRIAFRTVFSTGAATATSGSQDVIAAAGVRVPLVDNGDLRMNTKMLDTTEKMAIKCEIANPPPAAGVPADQAKIADCLHKTVDTAITAQIARDWNALRVDVGFAGSLRTRSGDVRPDSLRENSGGLWVATALPVTQYGQFTIATKLLASSADSADDERAREMIGGRLVVFGSRSLSVAVEVSSDWAQYRSHTFNQRWTHLGALAEWYVSPLKGWLGIGYGGDASRRGGVPNQFGLQYALYTSQILSK
jgi:hypothetical protein